MKWERKTGRRSRDFTQSIRKYFVKLWEAQIQLKSDETNCPYCGGFIQSNFYDWQIEDFMIYQTPDPNIDNLKYTSVTILLSFLPTFPLCLFDQEYVYCNWCCDDTYNYTEV